jgi:hypothetical protein
MSTSSKFTPEAKAKICALVESWGGNPDTFWDQKADSYEFTLAAVSLESLEQLYSELFNPSNTDATARLKCPPWPPGSKRAGQQPSERLLGKIASRFQSDATFDDLTGVSKFLNDFRAKCSTLPIAEQKQTLDSLTTLLGQELVKAKMRGVPVAAQLEAVDRLLTKEMMERESANQAQKAAQKEKDQALKQQQIEQGNRRITLLESKVKAASDEVKKLRDAGSQLSETERTAVLDKVDEILGLK